MDWRLLATTFSAVFIAELGDKTQLATVALASGKRAWLPVLVGAASALVCSTVLAVAAGTALGQYLPERVLKRAAGALFVILGVVYLWRG